TVNQKPATPWALRPVSHGPAPAREDTAPRAHHHRPGAARSFQSASINNRGAPFVNVPPGHELRPPLRPRVGALTGVTKCPVRPGETGHGRGGPHPPDDLRTCVPTLTPQSSHELPAELRLFPTDPEPSAETLRPPRYEYRRTGRR